MNALKIAQYLINMQLDYPELKISNLKLQKLLFYCQAFNLAETNKPLFEEKIEAWKYGPVIPVVYENYSKYGNSIISAEQIDENDENSEINISNESIGVISMVINAYGKMNAIALMEKTHREDPWKNTYVSGAQKVIEHNIMKDYYKDFLE